MIAAVVRLAFTVAWLWLFSLLSGCAGTARQRAADAGSVTIAATATARAQLVAWRDAREKAIPDECAAKCKGQALAVACFDACLVAERAPVARVSKALVGYRLALEASAAGAAGDLAGAAASLVTLAQEVTR